MVLNMVLNTVLNMNSGRSTNLISTKQFISFSFYIILPVFPRLILDFSLMSTFIRVNDSNRNKISVYSSSEMESSDNTFEMRLLIVLSAETANIAIFSIFKDSFLIASFPTTRSNPIIIDTASIPITAGAATIVERRPTQVIPNPVAVTTKQLSITPII